jgi:hypothetical protein
MSNLQVFEEEARITDMVYIVVLEDDKLGIYQDAKVMNMVMIGLNEETNDGGVLCLIVGG